MHVQDQKKSMNLKLRV